MLITCDKRGERRKGSALRFIIAIRITLRLWIPHNMKTLDAQGEEEKKNNSRVKIIDAKKNLYSHNQIQDIVVDDDDGEEE